MGTKQLLFQLMTFSSEVEDECLTEYIWYLKVVTYEQG